ncbi:MAG: Wzz/FepE/Etk N-terminal domain-containing protein [Solirubrobacteraceae bacterium]|nr:Wzz/FepE/Etk N-terminal domain-containing protein [Solirubrobacteraceae bacterium]
MHAVNHGPDREGLHELHEYLRPLRRRWPIVLLGLLLGTALGAGVAAIVQPTFTSTTSVVVTPNVPQRTDSSTGRVQGAINVETEAQLVRSHEVLTPARRLLELSEPLGELRSRVAVSAPANTTVMDISFSARSPRAAQAGARAVARAYLEYRRSAGEFYVREQARIVDAQIASLRRQVREQAAIVASRRAGSASRAVAEAQLDSYTAQLTALATSQTAATPPARGGRVIADAARPDDAGRPRAVLGLVGGMMLGLLLGISAALVRERTDGRLRDVAPFDERGVPVVLWPADHRTAAGTNGGRAGGLTASQRLCDLVFAACGTTQGTIVVAPLSVQQVDMGVARDLAASIASFGRSSALVRAGGQSAPDPDPVPPGAAADGRPLPPDHLHPAVEPPSFVAELLDGTDADGLDVVTLQQRLDALEQTAAFLVIVAPPVTHEPITQTLAGMCDGVVLVAQIGVTHTDDVADALGHLDAVRATVLGAVVLPRSPVEGRRRGRPPPPPVAAERAGDELLAADEPGHRARRRTDRS